MNFKYSLISDFRKSENNVYLINDKFELHISADKKVKTLHSKEGHFLKKRTYQNGYYVDLINYEGELIDIYIYKKTIRVIANKNFINEIEWKCTIKEGRYELKETHKSISSHHTLITKHLKKEKKSIKEKENKNKEGGYIYVLENVPSHNSYKVGRTKNLERRLKEHNSSVSQNSVYRFKIFFNNCIKAEKEIHKLLTKQNEKREFFTNSLTEIKDKINFVKSQLDPIYCDDLKVEDIIIEFKKSKINDEYFELK